MFYLSLWIPSKSNGIMSVYESLRSASTYARWLIFSMPSITNVIPVSFPRGCILKDGAQSPGRTALMFCKEPV